mgnify:CR=1 FL=1
MFGINKKSQDTADNSEDNLPRCFNQDADMSGNIARYGTREIVPTLPQIRLQINQIPATEGFNKVIRMSGPVFVYNAETICDAKIL